ncbi:neurofilament heavy polypeptide-like isoform X1 [Phoenix dactylifera]|uniref:Neurofilament heavy polypeptide-like isoform X1 n=1 Tax=Phoenix dactylifera TaxID=42345 RepID=A0A8B8J4E1_PHODC|nr:neurofilament heavy polypeptide-like isoform X1 [Phoenix dactylifera]
MATRVKEGVHLKEKSVSAPSTPGRTFLSDGGQTTADSPNRDIPAAQEKRVPNYLKPTVSSCHDTSRRYRKSQQQHPEDPATAASSRKRLISSKSMEKPVSPSSLPHKISKEKTPRSGLSLKPALSPKIVPERASKVPTSGKTLKKAKSFPKSMLRRREVNGITSTTTAIKREQEDKVLPMDNGVQWHAARHGSRSPKSNSEGKQWTTSEENDTGKPGAPRVKVTKKVSGNGVPRKLKFQQGRELEGEGKEAVGERLKSKRSGGGVEVKGEGKTEKANLVLKWQEVKEKDAPPASNDVMEETATKLATRRSNVKALVGAFESVISLQEPESQPSQQQEEVVAKVGRDGQPSQPKPEKAAKSGEEGAARGQAGRVKPEKEVEGGEEGAKEGQPDKQQPKKEVKDEEDGGEEESKGGHLGQESRQKETKGEEENGIEEESKGGQSGRESQQPGTEEEESKGEEGDRVAEEDVIAM